MMRYTIVFIIALSLMPLQSADAFLLRLFQDWLLGPIPSPEEAGRLLFDDLECQKELQEWEAGRRKAPVQGVQDFRERVRALSDCQRAQTWQKIWIENNITFSGQKNLYGPYMSEEDSQRHLRTPACQKEVLARRAWTAERRKIYPNWYTDPMYAHPEGKKETQEEKFRRRMKTEPTLCVQADLWFEFRHGYRFPIATANTPDS